MNPLKPIFNVLYSNVIESHICILVECTSYFSLFANPCDKAELVVHYLIYD